MPGTPSYLLNLAGEYRVCSELNQRGIFATVTYGNMKSVDVYAIGGAKALRIEVKTTQKKQFVTGISQKGLASDPAAPHFWVLFQLTSECERFFVLTHEEICRVQERRNRAYAERYRAKHGTSPYLKAGVDNVTVEDVTPYEGQWQKILEKLGATAGA